MFVIYRLRLLVRAKAARTSVFFDRHTVSLYLLAFMLVELCTQTPEAVTSQRRGAEEESASRVATVEKMTMMPNKSPEPTAVSAGRSAIAVHAASRRWLSFFR